MLTKQFGGDDVSTQQMGDNKMSSADREKAKDNHDRARTVEERGYMLQMG